ncbi:hypothetical protein YZ82_01645 [Campylobacter hyointestinalis]|uniref:Uncharacterized protein n=1 Tax=Campylobacter hyointestinalis TaxID=198 RepID=A0A562XKL8_CAMHY|nr:hypothetical protein [Campylobacter hyointestinalis]TWO22647.1 hypothetical protein YZ82_01645 [Campylobacter hyointestinalis]
MTEYQLKLMEILLQNPIKDYFIYCCKTTLIFFGALFIYFVLSLLLSKKLCITDDKRELLLNHSLFLLLSPISNIILYYSINKFKLDITKFFKYVRILQIIAYILMVVLSYLYLEYIWKFFLVYGFKGIF